MTTIVKVLMATLQGGGGQAFATEGSALSGKAGGEQDHHEELYSDQDFTDLDPGLAVDYQGNEDNQGEFEEESIGDVEDESEAEEMSEGSSRSGTEEQGAGDEDATPGETMEGTHPGPEGVWANPEQAHLRRAGAGAMAAAQQVGFVQDQWEVSIQQGQMTIYHHVPRTEFFVPGGVGFPCDVETLRNERSTRCMGTYADGQTFSIEWMDNWRIEGPANPELPPWTGYTVFTLQGRSLDGVDHPAEMEGTSSSEGTEVGDEELEDLDGGQTDEQQPGGGRGYDHAGATGPDRGGGGAAETLDCARDYIEAVRAIGGGTPSAWNVVREKGDVLLQSAGSVEGAARSLWSVREEKGMNNLKGVRDPRLDRILHPDHLAYLRDVEENGMNARFVGERGRVEGSLHPNARRNVDQVYKQLMKDIKKGRILVVSQAHPSLGTTVSSPFEVVQKMLPDRSLSKDMRLVHDQRGVNSHSHKDWHPPALQPTHAQIVRRVLWAQARYPGLPVLLAKKDIAGAFRLLWVDPKDAELFAGDLPWRPEAMEKEDEADIEAVGAPMTAIFLVSSFGFNGAPGEWTVFGRATEEWHRAHRPKETRRDGEVGFDSKILVDDNVLVEPWLGLRPWVSAECYEEGVRLLLGDGAINVEKDAMEGFFAEEQCVWGLTINTKIGKAFLPERRIQKGAHLLADVAFDPGQQIVTLKQMQQFRGVMTGWGVVVPALRNELKAADLTDGSKEVKPKLRGYGEETTEELRCWEDLWDLFTVCRWLASRTETWALKFGADLPDLLRPRERLSLPGAWEGVVYVTSDATPQIIGAVDWTFGLAARSTMEELRPWLAGVLEGEDEAGEGARIHLAEMLSLVAFLCERAQEWQGRLVLYGGDNIVVRRWVEMRQSASRAGRLLIRVLNACEMRYRFQLVAGWWRTYHNETADMITRSEEEKFEEFLMQRGWSLWAHRSSKGCWIRSASAPAFSLGRTRRIAAL